MPWGIIIVPAILFTLIGLFSGFMERKKAEDQDAKEKQNNKTL